YPNNPRAWYLLGTALRQQRPQGGLKELRRAYELDSGNEPTLREYGTALVENAKLDEARQVLTRAVALQEDDEQAHVALGRAYLGHITNPQDLERGLAELRRALALQPGEVQARFRLARALFQSNQLTLAGEEFSTALSLLGEGA